MAITNLWDNNLNLGVTLDDGRSFIAKSDVWVPATQGTVDSTDTSPITPDQVASYNLSPQQQSEFDSWG